MDCKTLWNKSSRDYVVTPNPWLIFYVLFVLRIISISVMTFLIGTTGRTCDRPRRNELRLITIKTASASPPSSQPHWWGKRMTSSLLSSSLPPPLLLYSFFFFHPFALIHCGHFSLSLSVVFASFFSCLTLSLFGGKDKKAPTFLFHSHVCCQGNMIQSIASCTPRTSHWCCCLLLVNTLWSNTKGYSSSSSVLRKISFLKA